jgi:hypothetical protein
MANDKDVEPDLAEQHRMPRDHENGAPAIEDEDGKIERQGNNQGPNGEHLPGGDREKKMEEKKPSKLKEMWGKLGLDMGTAMMMFKYVW